MKNILIVEDDAVLKSNISELLFTEGYNANSVSNGLEALDYIKKEIPDLIISDIMMPVMNGMELIKQVQSNAATSTIPFIFLTAKVEEQNIRLGMNSGADDYITKPFKTSELLKAVMTRLKKKENAVQHFEEMKIEIAAKVPHELRTPLVSILGYSDIILEEIDSLPRSEIKNYISRIRDAGEKIHERIEKFLIYAEVNLLDKGIKHGERIKKEVCSINQEEIQWIFTDQLKEWGRENDFLISIEEGTLKIAKNYLLVLLKESLENAVKYSKRGSPIILTGFSEEKYYKIVVKDNGCGMKSDELIRIEAFRQFETDDYKRIGVGLGLAIVKKILEIFAGKLKIKSKINENTMVTISIPIKETVK